MRGSVAAGAFGELDNLRVALRWLIGKGEADRAQRLAGAARVLWLNRGYIPEGRRWLEQALQLSSSTGQHEQRAAQARALLGITGVAWHQGDLAAAEDAGLRSVELFIQLHDIGRTAGALTFLGSVASARADLPKARRFMEQALLKSRESGPLTTVALNLCGLAELDLEDNDLFQAQRRAEESLKIARDAQDEQISCRALTILGEMYSRLGRPRTAQRMWRSALKRAYDAHEPYFSIPPALIRLGRLASESEDARFWFAESLVRVREVGRLDLARGFEVTVELAAQKGQADCAFWLAAAAAAMRDDILAPRWPSEDARVDASLMRVRQSLSEDAADEAWIEGGSATVDQSLAKAIEFLHQLSAERDDHPPILVSAESTVHNR